MTVQSSDAPVILAGSEKGSHAGNSVSTQVLFDALSARWPVDTVGHRTGLLPSLSGARIPGGVRWTLTTQPLTPHLEGFPAAAAFRRRFHHVRAGWVVNSRYAALPMTARIPYVLWEATTLSDEMAATSGAASRRAGLGTGVGATLHQALLPLNRKVERLSYQRAAVLLAMSEHTRNCMIAEHGLAPERVTCLPHPPTREYLGTLDAVRGSQARQPLGTALRLLFVGRVDDPRKNFELLSAAYRQARARGVAASLTVIGRHTARWRSNIELDETRDDVRFRGSVPVDELVRAYLSHDLLVISSRQEGFGIVVAEALHAGLPVLSTRCGGPEDTIASSRGGVLVEQDAARFSEALERLARERAELHAMGERGRSWAARELSFDRFAERVAAITEQVLARPRQP